MKKWRVWIAIAALLLCGCGAEETPVFETVDGNACVQTEKPAAGKINLTIPESAVSEAMADETGGEMYTWDGHTLHLQTLDGGDIQKTMESLTGMEYGDLTVMSYQKEELTYYQTVWSMAGEDGILVGKALVADDGYYHYCVSLLSPEETEDRDLYDRLCASFAVTNGDAGK